MLDRMLLPLVCLAIHGYGEELDEIPVADVVTVIQQDEDCLPGVACQCRQSVGWLAPAENSDKSSWRMDDASGSVANIRLDSTGGRYRVSWTAVRQFVIAEGGTTTSMLGASTSQAAMDGQHFLFWSRSGQGLNPPEDASGAKFNNEGLICFAAAEPQHQQGKGFLNLSGPQVGLAWLRPYFWPRFEPPRVLSEYILEKLDDNEHVQAWLTPSGTWKILIIANKAAAPYELEIEYSPSLHRMVGAVWGRHDREVSIETWRPVYVMHLHYSTEKDHWPNQVMVQQVMGIDPDQPNVEVWEYSDVTEIEEWEDTDFSVAFPAGLDVTDYVSGKSYIVGSGLENDLAAVDRFRKLHEDEFAKPELAAIETVSRMQQFLLVNGAVLLCVAVYVFAKWLGRKRSAAVLLCVCLPVPIASAQIEARLPTGQMIHVRQCGYLAAAFTLRHHDRDVNPNILEQTLPISDHGVSMGDLADLLESYGLEVRARKGLGIENLKSLVTSGWFAIVAVRTKAGAGHYFVAVQSKINKQPVVVDVLTAVQPLGREALPPDVFEAAGGIALLVREPAVQTPVALELKPAILNIGDFAVTGEERNTPIRRTVCLENRGTSCAILSVTTSCGCAVTGWQGGKIGSGEDLMIPVEIRPSAWGRGRGKKFLQVRLWNNQVLETEIVGTGLGKIDSQSLTTNPQQELRIDCTTPFE